MCVASASRKLAHITRMDEELSPRSPGPRQRFLLGLHFEVQNVVIFLDTQRMEAAILLLLGAIPSMRFWQSGARW